MKWTNFFKDFFKENRKIMYDMRFARPEDISFIMNEIDLGVNANCYTQLLKNPVEKVKFRKSLYKMIENSYSNQPYSDFLFVFVDDKDTPIAYTLIIVTLENQKQYLNIKMFGVKESLRGHGIGTIFLKEILDANSHHNFRAECLVAAKTMPKIFLKSGFKCIKKTSTGKKIFEKRAN